MKKILIIIAVLMTLCTDIYASGRKAEESPAVKVVMSHKKAVRMEGAMLKMARPERVIMVFEGDFTIDSLKRMGEISRQQAKH